MSPSSKITLILELSLSIADAKRVGLISDHNYFHIISLLYARPTKPSTLHFKGQNTVGYICVSVQKDNIRHRMTHTLLDLYSAASNAEALVIAPLCWSGSQLRLQVRPMVVNR
jgi:hypothetical protein